MSGLADYLPFPPRHDESARGLVVRLAKSNLLSSQQMCDWLGLPRIDTAFLDPSGAARKIGIEPAAFAALGFTEGETERFLGHAVPPQMAMRHVMRVCPACLAEAPYHRRIWDHQQLEACPIHRTMLLDRCPECTIGGRIRWGRGRFLEGDCGHDLTRQPAGTAGDCIGMAAVYRHCGLACDGPDLPPAFSGLPLQDLLELLFFLGRTDVLVAQGNPGGLPPRRAWSDGTVLDAGVQIALGWPEAFGDLAERVRAAYPDIPGVMAQYGYLHRFILRCGEVPYAGLLRSAYAAHLAGRGDVSAVAWPTFLPRPEVETDTVSTLTARELLGLGWKSFTAMRRLPLWTDINPVMSGRKGTPQYDRRAIVALGAVLGRLVSPNRAEQAIGLAEGKMTELIDAGMVPVYLWNRNHRNGEQRSVDMADLSALLASVRRHRSEAPPECPVSFNQILALAQGRSVIGFPEIIRALAAGEIRGHMPAGAAPAFRSLLFDGRQAGDLLDRMASSAMAGRVYLTDVMKSLGLPSAAVHHLVGQKLLPEPERRNAYLFDGEAVERFRVTFVYDTAIATKKGVSPAEVRKSMAAVDVSPVVTLTVKNGKSLAVYRKEDLAGMSVTKLRAGQGATTWDLSGL